MSDIQGIAAPGFLKPHQTLLGVTFEPTAAAGFKQFLHAFADEVSAAAETLEDRRRHRRGTDGGKTLVGIGFTFQGLSKLTPGAVNLPGDAFRQGLAARSALLGDPTDSKDEGNPVNWKLGATGHDLDSLLVVAGDARAAVA